MIVINSKIVYMIIQKMNVELIFNNVNGIFKMFIIWRV